MKKINTDLFDKLKYAGQGSYFRMGWCICDAEGNRCDDETVKEGRYLCVEDAYGYVVLYVDAGMVLVECTDDEEEGV